MGTDEEEGPTTTNLNLRCERSMTISFDPITASFPLFQLKRESVTTKISQGSLVWSLFLPQLHRATDDDENREWSGETVMRRE